MLLGEEIQDGDHQGGLITPSVCLSWPRIVLPIQDESAARLAVLTQAGRCVERLAGGSGLSPFATIWYIFVGLLFRMLVSHVFRIRTSEWYSVTCIFK